MQENTRTTPRKAGLIASLFSAVAALLLAILGIPLAGILMGSTDEMMHHGFFAKMGLMLLSVSVPLVLGFVLVCEYPEPSFLVSASVAIFTLAFYLPDASQFLSVVVLFYFACRLIKSTDVRAKLIGIFSEQEVTLCSHDLGSLRRGAAAAAYISSVVILLHDRGVFLFFIASVTWLAILWLIKSELGRTGRNVTFTYHVCVTLGDFFLVCTVATGALTVASWYVKSILIGNLTLNTLDQWSQWGTAVTHRLKALKLSSGREIILLCALIAARLVFARMQLGKAVRFVDSTRKVTKLGGKLLEKAYLAALVITSFTFFNSTTGSPVVELNTRIRDLDEMVLNLQSNAFRYLRDEYKIVALDRYWRSLDATTQRDLMTADKRVQDGIDDLDYLATAGKKYGISSELGGSKIGGWLTLLKEAGKSDSSDVDEGAMPTVPPDVRVSDVEEAYTRFRTEERESQTEGPAWQSPDALNGMSKGLAKKVFGALLPLDTSKEFVTAHVAFINAMGKEVPLFGELADALVAGAKDYTFDRLWKEAGKITRKKINNPSVSLLDYARSAAHDENSFATVALKPYVIEPEGEYTREREVTRSKLDELCKIMLRKRILNEARAISELRNEKQSTLSQEDLAGKSLDSLSEIEKSQRKVLEPLLWKASPSKTRVLRRTLGESYQDVAPPAHPPTVVEATHPSEHPVEIP